MQATRSRHRTPLALWPGQRPRTVPRGPKRGQERAQIVGKRPAVLVEAEFGPYFDALTADSVYACDDTLADERLAAMRDSYLVPHDIRASLDAAIGVNGSTLGVLCCAQQGSTRQWRQQEIRLLKRYADEVSLRRARRRAREGKTLTLMQELMQRVVEDSQPAAPPM